MHRRTAVLPWLIAATAVLQLWLAHRYFGFLTGDDVEVLAEGFRAAVGFDYRPWDIRSLFIPDFFVAPVVVLATKCGIRDPQRLIELTTLPFIAANAATIWGVHRLTLRWGADGMAADAAAALFAFHWIPLAFGGSVYPRTLATMAVVASALLVGGSRSFVPHAAAGALIGVAFADRFSEITFLAPLLLVAAGFGDPSQPRQPMLSRARRPLAVLAGAAGSIALLVGVYDWHTWGTPFESVRNFARLTLMHPDFASKTKYQHAGWYITNSAKWMAPTMLPLLWIARKRRGAASAAVFVLLPLIVLTVVRHKELRYLQALIPFLAIATAIGFSELWRSGFRRSAAVLISLSLAWNFAGIRMLQKKSMPSVMAARFLAADPAVRTVATSQLWACGDRLYLGDRRAVIDVATPPRDLANGMRFADSMIIYESDLDDQTVAGAIASAGFVATRTFRDGPARAVVVFRKR